MVIRAALTRSLGTSYKGTAVWLLRVFLRPRENFGLIEHIQCSLRVELFNVEYCVTILFENV